jgi:type VI secretion system protein ImpC
MAKRDWRTEVRLTSDVETEASRADDALDPDRKFIIAVLADLQGNDDAGDRVTGFPLSRRKHWEIDRDNIDEVMQKIRPRWRGRLGSFPGQDDFGAETALSFNGVDDFHPERIVGRVPLLQGIHCMLKKLADGAGMDEAEAAIRRWIQAPGGSGPLPPPAAGAGAAVDSGRLLDTILDQGRSAAPARDGSVDLQQFLRQIVEPHVIKVDSRRQEALRSAIFGILSHQFDSILHDSAFQRLEAAWRSLQWLTRNVDTDTAMKIWILPVRQEEILRDVSSDRDLEDSELAQVLLDPATVPGSERPSILIGDFAFTHTVEDLAVLERFGNIGARLKAPFIAAAGPGMVGCRSFASLNSTAQVEPLLRGAAFQPWRLLRKSAAARWIALAMPRLLARMPYGKDLDEVDAFDYEEGAPALAHEHLLWANPAYGVAAIYAAGFASYGWEMNLARGVPRLDGFPVYTCRVDGELVSKPCAEVLLNEGVVEALMEAGFLPVVSHRDTDMVSLPSLQTIADPRRAIPL